MPWPGRSKARSHRPTTLPRTNGHLQERRAKRWRRSLLSLGAQEGKGLRAAPFALTRRVPQCRAGPPSGGLCCTGKAAGLACGSSQARGVPPVPPAQLLCSENVSFGAAERGGQGPATAWCPRRDRGTSSATELPGFLSSGSMGRFELISVQNGASLEEEIDVLTVIPKLCQKTPWRGLAPTLGLQTGAWGSVPNALQRKQLPPTGPGQQSSQGRGPATRRNSAGHTASRLRQRVDRAETQGRKTVGNSLRILKHVNLPERMTRKDSNTHPHPHDRDSSAHSRPEGDKCPQGRAATSTRTVGAAATRRDARPTSRKRAAQRAAGAGRRGRPLCGCQNRRGDSVGSGRPQSSGTDQGAAQH